MPVALAGWHDACTQLVRQLVEAWQRLGHAMSEAYLSTDAVQWIGVTMRSLP